MTPTLDWPRLLERLSDLGGRPRKEERDAAFLARTRQWMQTSGAKAPGEMQQKWILEIATHWEDHGKFKLGEYKLTAGFDEKPEPVMPPRPPEGGDILTVWDGNSYAQLIPGTDTWEFTHMGDLVGRIPGNQQEARAALRLLTDIDKRGWRITR